MGQGRIHTGDPEGGTVGWDMCISETNFDKKIVQQFSDYVGVDVLSC